MLRAYGWDADGKPVADEARTLRWMAARALDGVSLRQIARELEDNGVETARGNTWGPITIRRTLVSPRIVGEKDGVEAILDRPTYDRLVALFSDPERAKYSPKNRSAPPTWLGGLLRCPTCDTVCWQQGPNMRCKCQTATIRTTRAEERVEATLVARIASPKSRAVLERVDANDSEARIEAAEQRIEQLAVTFGGGSSHQEAFVAGVEAAQAEIASALADARLAAAVADLPAPDVSAVVRWWEGLSVRQRGDVASLLLGSVVVTREVGSPRKRVFRFHWR